MINTWMKFAIILIIHFSLNTVALFGQSMEVSSGILSNNFFKYGTQEYPYWSESESRSGFFFEVSIDDVKVDWTKMRFTLGFESYEGKFSSGSNGRTSYSSLVNMDKSVLSATIYPLVLNIKKMIDFDFGIETSYLIKETFTGTYSNYSIDSGTSEGKYEENYDSLSPKFTVGLRARLAFNLNLNENLIISPQYMFYYGLSYEFLSSYSRRHFIGIGLERKLIRAK